MTDAATMLRAVRCWEVMTAVALKLGLDAEIVLWRQRDGHHARLEVTLTAPDPQNRGALSDMVYAAEVRGETIGDAQAGVVLGALTEIETTDALPAQMHRWRNEVLARLRGG